MKGMQRKEKNGGKRHTAVIATPLPKLLCMTVISKQGLQAKGCIPLILVGVAYQLLPVACKSILTSRQENRHKPPFLSNRTLFF